MSFLAARSLAEVLVSLATHTIILVISVAVLLLGINFILGVLKGATDNIERANKKGDSSPAVFWCIVIFLIYWFWFR
jgi:hypothetical protein